MDKLNENDIAEALTGLKKWSYEAGKLHRTFVFDTFVKAFGFMTSCAIVAERMNHHPEWSNVYNKVMVDLVTHDAAGVTVRDIELAKSMESLARSTESQKS